MARARRRVSGEGTLASALWGTLRYWECATNPSERHLCRQRAGKVSERTSSVDRPESLTCAQCERRRVGENLRALSPQAQADFREAQIVTGEQADCERRSCQPSFGVDRAADSLLPSGVSAGGFSWVPGTVVLLSRMVAPPLMSTSKRWIWKRSGPRSTRLGIAPHARRASDFCAPCDTLVQYLHLEISAVGEKRSVKLGASARAQRACPVLILLTRLVL